MDLGVLITLLEAAEGETRTSEGCCRRGVAATAWPPVAGSFTLGGGSRKQAGGVGASQWRGEGTS
jgi:hypothetical protein